MGGTFSNIPAEKEVINTIKYLSTKANAYYNRQTPIRALYPTSCPPFVVKKGLLKKILDSLI